MKSQWAFAAPARSRRAFTSPNRTLACGSTALYLTELRSTRKLRSLSRTSDAFPLRSAERQLSERRYQLPPRFDPDEAPWDPSLSRSDSHQPVLIPLPSIPVHVVQTPRIRLHNANRMCRIFGVLVVPGVIARLEITIPETVFRRGPRTARILPLRFRRYPTLASAPWILS